MILLALFCLIVSTESGVVNEELYLQSERLICSERNHVFLLPGVLNSGSSNRGCLSRLASSTRGSAQLQVVFPESGGTSHIVSLAPGDGGCIDFALPQSAKSKIDLIINVRYPDWNCTWVGRVTVRVLGNRVLLVQAERPRYRPGETLKLRVLQLRADLTPPHVPLEELWIEGPRGVWGDGVRVVEWSRVRTRLGVAQVQYQIDDQAESGPWTIRARSSDGSEGSTTIWVGDYQLPPFQLTVRHSSRVLRTSDRLVWTVCVRYPWSEAVQGLMVVRIRGAGAANVSIAGNSGNKGVRTVVQLRAPRACHRHAVAAARIGLHDQAGPDVIMADFSFQEDGTRVWQNTTVVSLVVEKPITLEFVSKHRIVIVPNLPYKLKVKATRWDEKPAAGVRVDICRTPTNLLVENWEEPNLNITDATAKTCEAILTDVRGMARVSFTVLGDDSNQYYNFKATLHNDTSSSASLQLPVSRAGGVRAAFGPLNADLGTRTLLPLYLTLPKAERPLTVHFVVITRGGTIYRWGATTQCPTTNSANFHTAPKDSRCDQDHYNNNYQNLNNVGTEDVKNIDPSDVKVDSKLLKVMLPIKMSHQMCPDSYLIAYFYDHGTLVTASKHLEVEDCFPNKAELTWLTRQVAPNSLASLQVVTSGPALCALSALDSAASWHQQTESPRDIVVTELRKMLAGHKNLTALDTLGECYGEEASNDDVDNALREFARAGVRQVGGDVPRAVCPPRATSAPASLVTANEHVPRTDFSEAWLWRLVAVGSNGTTTLTAQTPDSITRYEASAICIARNGISIAQPAYIQVFREFFLHADIPRKLRRGDTTILRYRLFNYMYESIPVQITVTTDYHLQPLNDVAVTECVGQRASMYRRIEVRALAAGRARLNVRARAPSVHSGVCANSTTTEYNNSDEIVIPIFIDHEGVPVEEYQSTLLCANNSAEISPSEVLWKWSKVSIVPGTESWRVWAVGDLTGPLLAEADTLVSLPRGCGEQNMARLATNLLALQQLNPDSSAAAIAKDHVAKGFTRQLQFAHPSGGFSAFGPSDRVPSTWLTAFCVRYMRRAHRLLSTAPVPDTVARAESWLLNQQTESGCFRSEGQLFHRELKGGLGDDGEIASVGLTAYVITSLLESGVTLPTRTLQNSLSCLRALPSNKIGLSSAGIYVRTLVTYAFMKLRQFENEVSSRNDATYLLDKTRRSDGLRQDEELKELMELLKTAKRNGNFVWWETGNLATSIEATGYAMLALAACARALREAACAGAARAAARWLAAHRSPGGGFMSTQDTLVAIEGLLSWSSLQASSPPYLNVTASSALSTQSGTITPASQRVPVALRIKPYDNLKVRVEGSGCALVQATRTYNVLADVDDRRNKALKAQVSVHTDGQFDCNTNGTSCYCAAVIEVCAVWSGEFPQMALMEVSLPGGYGVDADRLYSQLQKPFTLLRRIEGGGNNPRVTLYLGPQGDTRPSRGGHHCVELHAVGPKVQTRPAYARIIDYYVPDINDTQMYTIPEECPPRISRGPNNNGRSLKEDNDTEGFSFEDIPDGIPLEDPLYDNLKMTNKEEWRIENVDSDRTEEIYDGKLSQDASTTGRENDKEITETDKAPKNSVSLKDIESSMKDNNKKHDATNPLIHTSTSKDYEKVNEIELPIKKTTHLKNILDDKKEKREEELTTTKDVDDHFSDFHVINRETDLEFPTGVEGPVPSVVLPPHDFKTNTENGQVATSMLIEDYARMLQRYSINSFSIPHPSNEYPYSTYNRPYLNY